MKKLGVLAVLVFISLWHLSIAFNIFSNEVLPFPHEVFEAFLDLAQNSLLKDVIESSLRVLVGFSIAAICGIFFGALLAYYKPLNAAFSPLIELVRPIPPIAWIPLSILWFGIGNLSSFFLVALGAFFPIFSSAFNGVKNVGKSHVFTAKSFGASDFKVFSKVVFPSALPSILTGLEVGLGIAWMVVIAAELVGATSGLGYMIQLNRLTLQTANIVVGMIAIGIIGFGMQKLLKAAEKHIVPWKLNC